MTASAMPPTYAMAKCLGAITALAAVWLGASHANAAAFNIPEACNGRATGSEDLLDPVVLLSYDAGKVYRRDYSLDQEENNTWSVTLGPTPTQSEYVFSTTFTPFLYSSTSVYLASRKIKKIYIPDPQYEGFDIYPTQVLVVYSEEGEKLSGGSVAFKPQFIGASPYVMSIESTGEIKLECVQKQAAAYALSVYGPEGSYLYDSEFRPQQSGKVNIGRPAEDDSDAGDAPPPPQEDDPAVDAGGE